MKTKEKNIQTGKMEENEKSQVFSPLVDYCNYLNWVLYTCSHFMCQHEHESREMQHLVIFVSPSGESRQPQPARYLHTAPRVGKLQSADGWIRLIVGHLVRLDWVRLGKVRWTLFSIGLVGPKLYQYSVVPY